jgi:hypothetical protein
MKRITKIRVSDGGDGSTIFRLTYNDGTTDIEGPDVPYDGYVDFDIDEDGNITSSEVEEGDPNEDWRED